MKSKQVGALLLLLVFVITGCIRTEPGKIITGQTVSSNHAISVASTHSVGKAGEQPLSNSSTVQAPVSLSFGQIKGDIRNIYYADENKAFLSADQLVLVDLQTGRAIAETAGMDFDQQLMWATKRGYVAVGVKITTGNSSSGGLTTGGEVAFRAVFYDQMLKKLTTFDFSPLLKKNEHISFLKAIAISSDGTQAAYATNNGLYLYNFNTKKKTTVIDLQAKDIAKRSGIVTFEQIGFTNKDKTLAFKAQSLEIPVAPGKTSFDSCGTVGLNGSGLANLTFDNYTCKELTAYDQQLLLAEDFTIPSGRLLVMGTPGSKKNFLRLTEKGESGFVTGSDKGRYFATTLAEKGKTGWEIRVYETSTGKLQAEQHLSSGGEARYMANDPIVKVFDDERTYIVLLGARQLDIKPKIVAKRF